jgi:hypothetical protein
MENQEKKGMRKRELIISCGLFLSLFLILVLAILPNGVVMRFASGPGEYHFPAFSYFSMMPFGYAYHFPGITVILTFVSIILSISGLLRKQTPLHHKNGILICAFFIFILSFTPIPWVGGIEYMTFSNYGIAALSLILIILMVVAKCKTTRERG